jgi:hypothetical protein
LTRIGSLRRRSEVIRARGWREIPRLAKAAARRPLRARSVTSTSPQPLQILVYQTIDPTSPMPQALPGMRLVETWSDVIETIRVQQNGKDRLRVVLYPCAPLQVFEE